MKRKVFSGDLRSGLMFKYPDPYFLYFRKYLTCFPLTQHPGFTRLFFFFFPRINATAFRQAAYLRFPSLLDLVFC